MAIFFLAFEFSVVKIVNTPINMVKSAIPTPGCGYSSTSTVA